MFRPVVILVVAFAGEEVTRSFHVSELLNQLNTSGLCYTAGSQHITHTLDDLLCTEQHKHAPNLARSFKFLPVLPEAPERPNSQPTPRTCSASNLTNDFAVSSYKPTKPAHCEARYTHARDRLTDTRGDRPESGGQKHEQILR